MHPKYLKIEDYNYQLPEDKIAQYPKGNRDDAKLLVYKGGMLSEDIYRNIAQYLPSKSLLVFNQTKVVPVRLLFKKSTGATIELFCLEPDSRYADMQTAMTQCAEVYWNCLVGGANKWKDGQVLSFYDEALNATIFAHLIERKDGCFLIKFTWDKPLVSFSEILNAMGKVPLPPYMHRDTQLADKERYQTIYASEDGSVAAPTAGLHFTPYIFEQLGMQHITTDFLTLHVGAGTFKQVKSETLAGHEMHAEWIEFTLHFLENLLTKLGSVVAVGTTSMRTLESLYWLGLKLFLKQKVNWADIAVLQFDPYEMNDLISPQQALTEIIDWMKSHHLDKLITRTQIMIAPSYVPKIVNKLVTNFHQPHSTLLLLIAALIGKDWEMLYQFALNNDYRFLSYGDGCLIDFSA